MDKHFFYELVNKYLDGVASDEERHIVEGYYKEMSEEDSLSMTAEQRTALKKIALQEIQRRIAPAGGVVPMWRRYVAAAAVVAVLCAGAYFIFFNKPVKPTIALQNEDYKNDVAPGGNKAVLTLGNGQQIVLDSAHNGVLALQGNTKIVKTDSGKLAYNILTGKPTEVTYNVLSTPRGGQYQLTLPDGSQVWLNAASSIKYPTAFIGKERTVEITGEAYFEVAHKAGMPFKVKVADEIIEDIGTHFNINAYADERSINTTLLEGAVKVNDVQLKPGQQAQGNAATVKVVNGADIDQVMAWKNGKFDYHNADLKTIMRQMARWYDVEVIYKDQIEDHYTIDVPRNVPVSQLFKFIEMSSGVHFEIDGKKITVKK